MWVVLAVLSLLVAATAAAVVIHHTERQLAGQARRLDGSSTEHRPLS